MSDLVFYPDVFPRTQDSGSPLSQDEQIAQLKQEVFDGAIDVASQARTIGWQTITNQNQLMMSFNTRVPFTMAGKAEISPAFYGTQGFFVAGQDGLVYHNFPLRCTTVHHIPFLSESLSVLGAGMAVERQWPGVTGNSTNFYTAGGWGDNPSRIADSIDRTPHLNPVNALIGSKLTVGRRMSAGYGNGTYGYWFGGGMTANGSNSIERIAYDGEIAGAIASTLNISTVTSLTIAGESTRALVTGSTDPIQFSPQGAYGNIQSFTFAGETCTTIAQGIASIHWCSGFTGNSQAAYMLGGKYNFHSIHNRALSRFILATNTFTQLGVQLDPSYGAAACGGMGSSDRGYWNQGWSPTMPWPYSNRSIFKVPEFIQGAERLVVLGIQLIRNQAENPAISDYAPGYING